MADVMAENGIGKRLVKVGLNDTYAHGASKMYLLKKYHMGAMDLIGAAEKLMGKNLGIQEQDMEDIRFVDFSAV